MIYLDELIASHRKILRAGQLIGDAKGGPMAALGLFVAALGYARSHLTDGLVPDEYLLGVSRSRLLISVLGQVNLLKKSRGGYWRIHDFHEWNKTAAQVIAQRRDNAARQRRFKARKEGDGGNGNGVSNALVTRGSRMPTIPYPLCTIPNPGNGVTTPTVRFASPAPDVRKREQRPGGRDARGRNTIPLSPTQRHKLAHTPAADGNLAVLVCLIHKLRVRHRGNDVAELLEAVKCVAARRRIVYDADVLTRAWHVVEHQSRRAS